MRWAVQVTLIGFLAGGLYLVVRRLKPVGAASILLTGLATVVVLSVLALSPWPRWEIWDSASLGERSMVAAAPARTARPPMPRLMDTPANFESRPSSGRSLSQAQAEASSAAPTSAVPRLRHWPAVVGAILLAAMTCGMGWLLLGIMAVRRQRLRSRPVIDAELLQLIDSLRAELGCQRPVEVRQSDDLTTAATIGWRRPVVLLPADWRHLDRRRAAGGSGPRDCPRTQP